jgi:predicted nucleotidyltransferase
MRITRETLLKIARDTVADRVRSDHSIAAIYLVGSLLDEDPLLGGTTDIDLVIIHDRDQQAVREVVRLSSEITLDIAHHIQSDYSHPRHLRANPWIGPALFQMRTVLHDTQHWLEFTQASACAQFNRPENVLDRARQPAEAARQAWLKLQSNPQPASEAVPGMVWIYLKSLELAANAISSLSGAPLTERRFLLGFTARATQVNKPGLAIGLTSLLGADLANPDLLQSWLPVWAEAYRAASVLPAAPLRLHPDRRLYYERGMTALLAGKQPLAAIWPLLRTWTLASSILPNGSPHLTSWLEACHQLHLGPEDMPERISALDAYLDTVEETLDAWAKTNGV